MSELGILTKSVAADYCNYCNRHQERTMPETVFYFGQEKIDKNRPYIY